MLEASSTWPQIFGRYVEAAATEQAICVGENFIKIVILRIQYSITCAVFGRHGKLRLGQFHLILAVLAY